MGRRATTDEIGWAERILIECFSNSAVDVVVVGDDLSCIAINTSLAAKLGPPLNAHLRKTLREVLGEAGSQLEAAVRQVLDTGRPVVNVQIMEELTNKTGAERWVGSLLPLTDESGNVTRVGVILVELAPNTQAEPCVYPYSPRTALHSWKEIAEYVGTSVKTVQRWEQIHDFPVRRLRGERGAMVFALRDEVDSWVRSKARLANAACLGGTSSDVEDVRT